MNIDFSQVIQFQTEVSSLLHQYFSEHPMLHAIVWASLFGTCLNKFTITNAVSDKISKKIMALLPLLFTSVVAIAITATYFYTSPAYKVDLIGICLGLCAMTVFNVLIRESKLSNAIAGTFMAITFLFSADYVLIAPHPVEWFNLVFVPYCFFVLSIENSRSKILSFLNTKGETTITIK